MTVALVLQPEDKQHYPVTFNQNCAILNSHIGGSFVLLNELNYTLMKSFLLISSLWLMLASTGSAQSHNKITETVNISGNCGMCESTIEKSGSLKHKSKVDWDRDTKTATMTYNPNKTSKDEILKRIALAGYDNEAYLAPDEAYNNLSGCCQYNRPMKTMSAAATGEMPGSIGTPEEHQNHHAGMAPPKTTTSLQPVYDAYFALKDALVKSDGVEASAKGTDLLAALKAVDMGKLANEEHMQWMKTQSALLFDAEQISKTQDIEKQREAFVTLSVNMYLLIKTSTLETPVYFQHCPMANDGKGADWLSKESGIKNPYYGSMMLTCGRTVETLQ
jgi:copper chaperone CopZ